MFKIAARSIISGLIVFFLTLNAYAGETPDNTLVIQAWKTLTSENYSQKSKAIEVIAANNPPDAYIAMRAMFDGMLYYSSDDKKLYVLRLVENNYKFKALFSTDLVIQVDKHGFKEVKINNHLRGILRKNLAIIHLNDKDEKVRLSAIKELLKHPDSKIAMLVKGVFPQEKNTKVKAEMRTLLAINQLKHGDGKIQFDAVNVLADSLNPSAFNVLSNFQSSDPLLKTKIAKAIKYINAKKSRYDKIETLFFGLSLGSVLALAAIGLAITFGVMGVINMAHGELIMIGAYTTYSIQQLMPGHIALSIIVAIPAAFVVSGLVGIVIERSVIRHLYGRPLETLLATFGVSLILRQTVRSIFSPLNRSVITPQWMSGAWHINEILSFTWNRFYIIIFCLMVFSALIFVMKKTSLGLQVRAVSQNRTMARAMGVRSEWVDALTFGLGSGIAGIAGVALSILTNVGPNLGQDYIIDSFMVVVFGGVGNLGGTLIAGMSIGVVNQFLEPLTGAVLAKILVLVFIILFIQKRPKGLFPQRGRAAED